MRRRSGPSHVDRLSATAPATPWRRLAMTMTLAPANCASNSASLPSRRRRSSLYRHCLLRGVIPAERAAFAHGFDREQARKRRVEADFEVAHRLVPRLQAIQEIASVRDRRTAAVGSVAFTPRYPARLDGRRW